MTAPIGGLMTSLRFGIGSILSTFSIQILIADCFLYFESFLSYFYLSLKFDPMPSPYIAGDKFPGSSVFLFYLASRNS